MDKCSQPGVCTKNKFLAARLALKAALPPTVLPQNETILYQEKCSETFSDNLTKAFRQISSLSKRDEIWEWQNFKALKAHFNLSEQEIQQRKVNKRFKSKIKVLAFLQLFSFYCTENFLKKQSFKLFNARSNLLQPRKTSRIYKTSTDTGIPWYQRAIASCSRSLTAIVILA